MERLSQGEEIPDNRLAISGMTLPSVVWLHDDDFRDDIGGRRPTQQRTIVIPENGETIYPGSLTYTL